MRSWNDGRGRRDQVESPSIRDSRRAVAVRGGLSRESGTNIAETVAEEHPGIGAEQFLAIARILRPQGRRGEVAAEVLTDFVERFAKGARVYVETPGGMPELRELEKAWPHKGGIVLKLAGVDSIEAASRLRGLHVLIRREARTPLTAGRYYLWELEGCRVVQEQNGALREVGTVTGVETTGGVELLRVALPSVESGGKPEGKPREALIPLAQAICKRIDPQAKLIVIDPPDDLLDLNS